jgi:hypothetical protein
MTENKVAATFHPSIVPASVPLEPGDQDPPNPRRDALEALMAYCDEHDLLLPYNISFDKLGYDYDKDPDGFVEITVFNTEVNPEAWVSHALRLITRTTTGVADSQSVIVTWEIEIESIEVGPDATPLLIHVSCCYLDPDDPRIEGTNP